MPMPRVARFALLCVLVLISACASHHEPGWRGQGAQPFESAHRQCEAEAATVAESERESRMQACMAARGWTRERKAG